MRKLTLLLLLLVVPGFAEGTEDLDPDTLEALPQMAEDPTDYWQTRSELKWT